MRTRTSAAPPAPPTGRAWEPDDFAVLVAPLRRPLTQGTTLYQAATAHIATASRSLTWQSTRWPWRDGR